MAGAGRRAALNRIYSPATGIVHPVRGLLTDPGNSVGPCGIFQAKIADESSQHHPATGFDSATVTRF